MRYKNSIEKLQIICNELKTSSKIFELVCSIFEILEIDEKELNILRDFFGGGFIISRKTSKEHINILFDDEQSFVYTYFPNGFDGKSVANYLTFDINENSKNIIVNLLNKKY